MPSQLFPRSINNQEVYAALEGAVRAGFPQNYTQNDQRRDFLRVFTANDEGRRVLAAINAMCNPPTFEKHSESHGVLAFRAGMRHVMDLITRAMSEVERPETEKKEYDPHDY